MADEAAVLGERIAVEAQVRVKSWGRAHARQAGDAAREATLRSKLE